MGFLILVRWLLYTESGPCSRSVCLPVILRVRSVAPAILDGVCHISRQWSLAWYGVLCAMPFDISLYILGHNVAVKNVEIMYIIPRLLFIICSSVWTLFICDKMITEICIKTFDLAYIFKVIWGCHTPNTVTILRIWSCPFENMLSWKELSFPSKMVVFSRGKFFVIILRHCPNVIIIDLNNKALNGPLTKTYGHFLKKLC